MRFTAVSWVMALTLALTTASVGAAGPDQPRLKFRAKGPVCSCASGMSEADISKAWEARFAQTRDDRPEASDDRPATRDEQRRGVDETQPR